MEHDNFPFSRYSLPDLPISYDNSTTLILQAITSMQGNNTSENRNKLTYKAVRMYVFYIMKTLEKNCFDNLTW